MVGVLAFLVLSPLTVYASTPTSINDIGTLTFKTIQPDGTYVYQWDSSWVSGATVSATSTQLIIGFNTQPTGVKTETYKLGELDTGKTTYAGQDYVTSGDVSTINLYDGTGLTDLGGNSMPQFYAKTPFTYYVESNTKLEQTPSYGLVYTSQPIDHIGVETLDGNYMELTLPQETTPVSFDLQVYPLGTWTAMQPLHIQSTGYRIIEAYINEDGTTIGDYATPMDNPHYLTYYGITNPEIQTDWTDKNSSTYDASNIIKGTNTIYIKAYKTADVNGAYDVYTYNFTYDGDKTEFTDTGSWIPPSQDNYDPTQPVPPSSAYDIIGWLKYIADWLVYIVNSLLWVLQQAGNMIQDLFVGSSKFISALGQFFSFLPLQVKNVLMLGALLAILLRVFRR